MPDAPQPTNRIPAEVWHPSVFIQDELDARGWTLDDLALRMGGDFGINRLSLDFYFAVGPEEPDLLIGNGEDFARAFGVDAEYFRNLERAWREHPSTQPAIRIGDRHGTRKLLSGST